MIQIIWQILPISIGVIASPVAIQALIGIMLSERGPRDVVAYAMGWILAVAGLLAFWLEILRQWDEIPGIERALLIRVLHVLIAVICIVGSFYTFGKARGTLARIAIARSPEELVAATPQLPGLLRSAEHFRPARCFGLGAAIFLLNPMNVSLVVAAAIDISTSTVAGIERIGVAVGFVAAAAVPVVVPPLLVAGRRSTAEGILIRLRTWLLHNSGFVSAAILLLVGFTQFGRAFDGVLT